MEKLLDVYEALLPVMAFVVVGYFVSKKTKLKSEYISKPLIQVLLPLLVFSNMLDAEPSKLLILPVLTFLLAFGMRYVALLAQKKMARETDPLILRSAFSFFNIAFFGIPIVSAMFGEESVSVLICIYLGSALYGDTIGYYQVAKTKHSPQQALKEVFRIPFLYVFVAGVICKLAGLETPDGLKPAMKVVSFAVSALGMAVIGFQLAAVDFGKIRAAYYLKLLFVRTFGAVIIMAGLMLLASLAWKDIASDDYVMLGLVPLFPVAANVTVFAAFLETEEEQSSLLVFFSMLFSVLLVSVAVLVLDFIQL